MSAENCAFFARRGALNAAMPAPANRLVIALAQIPSIVGDIEGNLERLRARARRGRGLRRRSRAGAELFLSGYPPEDLVLKPAFQEACRAACETLARETADGGPAVLVGLPWVEGGALYNAAALLAGGRIEAVRFKVDLPNYGVFDEKRVFRPGPVPGRSSFTRRAHRRADLRGHLGAGPGRMHRRDRRRNPARAQRLAL